jgi:hypothetical protein
MDPILSPTESVLLQYLSQRSAGRGQRTALDPKSVLRGLRIGKERFEVDAAALSGLGFAGTRRCRPAGGSVRPTACSAVWVTGEGENFLKRRQFELRLAEKTPVGS